MTSTAPTASHPTINSAAMRPTATRAVDLYTRFFFNRADMVAGLDSSSDAKPTPIKLVDVNGSKTVNAAGTRANDPFTAIVASHLMGRRAPYVDAKWCWKGGAKLLYGPFRIGSYAPAEDNTTRWICIDFDGKGHADALRNALTEARKTLARAAVAGIPGYLERSGGAAGYHVWMFFAAPVDAAIAKRIGHWLVPRDAQFADGSRVNPNGNKGIEVFPKQSKHRGAKATGNMVWLPWWSGAMPSGNLFYRDSTTSTDPADDDGNPPIEPYLPDDFIAMSSTDVARVVALIDGEDAQTAIERAAHVAAQEAEANAAHAADLTGDPTAAPSTKCDVAVKTAYDTWKRVAVASVHLEVPYGDIITGMVKGGGWLEARDPDSPTGDRHPSAGVADGSGTAKRGTFHSHRTGESLDIFAYLIKYKGHKDFMSAARYMSEVSGVPLPKPRVTSTASTPSCDCDTGDGQVTAARLPPDTRPEINVANEDLLTMTQATWSAVRAANAKNPDRPRAFRSNHVLVELMSTDRGPAIRYMMKGDVLSLATRAARFVKEVKSAIIPALPPHDILTVMLNRTDDTLPRLDEVITTPVFDTSGAMISAPGYHANARVWHHRPDGFDVGDIPDVPSTQDIDAARSLIVDDLLHDFPFSSQADRCHAVAAILLPFIRRMIAGNTPLHLLEAPTPGSGKGLLADTISMVVLGQPCSIGTLSKNDEDTRKEITAILIRGAPVNLIDNVVELKSAALAASITGVTWSGRLLGHSKMMDLPNRALWLITGNNPAISSEIVRRCVRIRVDPKTDRPWKRSGFKHHPLIPWIADHRAEIVHAALVLIQSWVTAGKKLGTAKLGSFDEYAAIMSGLLGHIGVPGFLENAEELYEAADDEGSVWREFLSAWAEKAGVNKYYVPKQIRDFCVDNDLMMNVLGDKGERSQVTRLGHALGANRDRVFGGLTIIVDGKDGRGKKYAIARVHVDSGSNSGVPNATTAAATTTATATATTTTASTAPSTDAEAQCDMEFAPGSSDDGDDDIYDRYGK